MELQHSQTWKNLQTAFSGELHACAKYKIYALRAREDGYEQMGNIFDETSRNEQEHAEIWLKHLSGGEVPGTLENLRDAAAGEHYEWTECCFSKRMRNFFRKNEKSVLQFCNKKPKRKGRLQRVEKSL